MPDSRHQSSLPVLRLQGPAVAWLIERMYAVRHLFPGFYASD